MQKKQKKNKNTTKLKEVKLDPETHKALKIYAAENSLGLGESIHDLLNKVAKREKGLRKKSG